jgi:uncharacterized membrane protein
VTDVGYASDEGKTAALLVWLLYLISVPSVGILLPAGLILAYVARGNAAPWVRDHLAKQIKVGWTAVIWYAIAWLVFGLGVVTAVVLIGFPIMGISWIIGAVLALWLIVVSALGFLRLLNERPA